jgi:hypothetical protein
MREKKIRRALYAGEETLRGCSKATGAQLCTRGFSEWWGIHEARDESYLMIFYSLWGLFLDKIAVAARWRGTRSMASHVTRQALAAPSWLYGAAALKRSKPDVLYVQLSVKLLCFF